MLNYNYYSRRRFFHEIEEVFCWMIAIVLTFLVGCTQVNESSEPTETENADKELSILFIGNSYTYFNNMPTKFFKEMAETAGYDVKVFTITKGAHTLSEFADPEDKYGAVVESTLNGKRKFDFVVLQEQSTRPARDDVPEFYSAVRNLAARIRSRGATPILYATWGHKAGSETLDKHGWTTETMAWRVAAAYQAIGNELEIDVAYSGLAYLDVYTNNKDIELYDFDCYHPSETGSFLAAATLFAKIFNEDPTTLTVKGPVSDANTQILLAAAKKAAFDTPDIPDQYKVSSNGVG